MTDRKPPGLSFETWVERQIREAAERGEFDDLPGAGKPIADLDKPYHEMWWVRRKLRDENLSVLPPTLALRKEIDAARATALQASSESEVRAIVSTINEKIAEANAKPRSGPPLDRVPFDIDAVVSEWRARAGRFP